MKIAHVLPLDDRATGLVVADWESLELSRHFELQQGFSHPTLALANVYDNEQLHRRKSPPVTAAPPVPVQDGYK